MTKVRLSAVAQRKLDSEIDDILSSISKEYGIELDELKKLSIEIDNICIASVWNNNNKLRRCSRQKTCGPYCNLHHKQFMEFGHTKLGNFNQSIDASSFKSDIDLDDYVELECELIEYNDKEYYLERNIEEVYVMSDFRNGVVKYAPKGITQEILELI